MSRLKFVSCMARTYSWTEIDELTERLAEKIDFKPDYIVGIPRGGVVPARLLAKHLRVDRSHFITVDKVGDSRTVSTRIKEDLAGKKILLVEDMLESGESLRAARNYLLRKKALVKTVAYFARTHSKIKPDYFLEQHDEEVIFPWE